MTEKDRDQAEVAESRKALREAEVSAVKADLIITSLHQTGNDIRSIVERNGYVDRFRQLLRGA